MFENALEGGNTVTTSNGYRLKETRIKHHKQQAEVAAVIGVSQSGYSLIERGGHDISAAKLIELARYYDCTVDELLGCGKWDTQARGEADESTSRLQAIGRSWPLIPSDAQNALVTLASAAAVRRVRQ